MLSYYVQTALRSLRRTPILTAVLIGAIALGICISTTFIAHPPHRATQGRKRAPRCRSRGYLA